MMISYTGMLNEFATRDEAEKFLNEYASVGPDFQFDVIEGRRAKVEPIEVVKQFRVK
jgi:hypothetical protein